MSKAIQRESDGKQSDGKLRLVLVEDYKLIRIGIRMVLDADNAFQVVGEGESGEQALALVKQHQPDLLLLDLGLPDMDGLQLTREIRKFNQTTKILILTSHETEDSVIMALAAGANGYCLKDIVSERLVEVVKSVCEGALWLDPRVASRALQVFAQGGNKRALTRHLALTDREREVLRFIVEGMSNSQIAKALDISLHTSKAHVCSILQKLSVQDRMQAAVKAVQHALL
ncbi:response regulator [Vampirovibrio sp.]|uniref:response regulator n=1 Tax=Vampirovibrio sp. TaxID=2717857 RepID=UPI003593A063